MCLEAHDELGWDALEFDTQGERVIKKWRRAAKKRERDALRRVLL